MTQAPRSTSRTVSRPLAMPAMLAVATALTLAGCVVVGVRDTPAAASAPAHAAPATRAVVGAPPTAGAPGTAAAPGVEAPHHVFTIGETTTGSTCELTGDFTMTTPSTHPINLCGSDRRRCARTQTGQVVYMHNDSGRSVTVFFDPFARRGHPIARGATEVLRIDKAAFGRSPEPKTFTFFVRADDGKCDTLDPKIIVEN